VSEPRRHLWIEVTRDSLVLGVEHSWSPDGTVSSDTLDRLRQRYGRDPGRQQFQVSDSDLPTISVVVPTVHRDAGLLLRTVRSLCDLDYPAFEILVVDNRPGQLDSPMPDLDGMKGVRVVAEEQPGTSAARNRGVSESLNDIVAFTDDDAIVDRYWLRALGEVFVGNPSVDGVGGLVLPSEIDSPAQLWFEEFYGGFNHSFGAEVLDLKHRSEFGALFPYSPAMYGAGCNMAFRRQSLQSLGGFPMVLGPGTPARGGEDLAVCIETVLRGGRYAFAPSALVRHTHRRTEEAFLGQVFGYGVGLSAMLTYLVARDPRRLADLLRRVPAGVMQLRGPRDSRNLSTRATYPRRAHLIQLLGLAYGPLAVAVSAAKGHRRVQ
jgi:GT2 family glycosyltransferase